MAEQIKHLSPLVNGWVGKLDRAIATKKPFQDVADECWQFFSGATDFMHNERFQNRYFGGSLNAKFKVTIAKAFELVALFGPTLNWRNPQRRVQPRRPIDLDPTLFGNPQDPQVQQLVQQIQQEEGARLSKDQMRASLLETYLNYTPIEQPAGGLSKAAELATTEALVKGRGCLWTEPYESPGSQHTLSGSFFDSVDNLLIDPDAESLDDAWWIARKRTEPTWWVEREFNLPKGSLDPVGDRVYDTARSDSGNSQGTMQADDLKNMHFKSGKTQDLITYYQIWSKAGVGSRMAGMDLDFSETLDEQIGDYAYLAICKSVPYPLNCPENALSKPGGAGEVKERFRWPIPTYMDDRWPVQCLDFYAKPRSPWPIAPLSPGMGELIFMNVMMSSMMSKIWDSSRTLLSCLKSAAGKVKTQLSQMKHLDVLELDDVHGDIKKVLQVVEFPNITMDSWRIMDAVNESFEKRTGLNDLLYGLNPGGSQDRSATATKAKQAAVSVRPEWMAGQVERWHTELARTEKMVARWYVKSEAVKPLLGPVGAYFWKTLIETEDPERIVREMSATVEAGSVRKPNKDRDIENMNQLVPFLAPVLDNHANATTDTNPLNKLLELHGKAMDQDMSQVRMGPRQPPPPPPEVQQQQQQMQQMEAQKQQMEMAKIQAEVQLKQMELGLKQAEAQQQGMSAQVEAQQKQMELQFEMASKAADLQMDQRSHEQELRQDQETHVLDLLQGRQMGDLKLEQTKEQGKAKIENAKAAARAKPQSNGSAKK